MPKALELVGEQFGRLRVQSRSSTNGSRGQSLWDCICECGNTVTVVGYKLKEGHNQSCGCLIKDTARELARTLNASHYRSGSSEYSSWQNMKSRCIQESGQTFCYYGERGITVCDRWKNSFEAFYADMGPKPSLEHSIDRFPNVNGNYEPGNCRWATPTEQQNNKRNNVLYEYGGNTYTQTQLCALTGIDPTTFKSRINRGKSVEEALK